MNKGFIIILFVLLSSCIEDYFIEDRISFDQKIVVDAHIIKNENIHTQEISISKTSPVSDNAFIPYDNCQVNLFSADGNEYEFIQSNYAGKYICDIPSTAFIINGDYWIEIITPQGKKYKSTVETLNDCPPIDSIYYDIEHKETEDLDINTWGVQFFTDFEADFNYSAHYLFEIEETYEHHSQWPIEIYINEFNMWINGPIDYSKYTCYSSFTLSDIFTLSTDGFTENTYIKLPLHFTNNKTQRLMHNYSFVLKQYSSSEAPYLFWSNLKENNQEGESLFGKQPSSIKGNITCIDNPDEIALGYFGISKMTEKRITISGGVNIPFGIPQCTPIPLEFAIPDYPRPLYLQNYTENGETLLGIVKSQCVDCTLLGGTTEKPDFFN